MKDAVDAYIRANEDRFVEELKDLLRFPSVSAQRDHDKDTLACARWLRDHLAGLGLTAELADQGGRPVIVARGEGSGSKRVVIYGHYDVQPEDPRDQWLTDPFEPVIRDRVLYARGATDDKGQLFTHVKAVEALIRTRGALPCEVVFLVEGEEESGGDALGRYVRGPGRDLGPDAVIISDTSMYDEATPAITYGLRGIMTLEFTIKGPYRDVHSGEYGGAVANPALVLARMLSQCVGPDGRVLIPHFYDDVQPPAPWERENLRQLALDDRALAAELKVPGLHGEAGFSTLERLWARPTFEINGLYGGYQGPHSKTIIPASATAKVSVRLVPDQDPDRMRALIYDHLRAICPACVTLEIAPESAGAPPALFAVDSPVMNAATQALKEGFDTEPVFIRCGGSIPVVNTFARQWHCPVVLMGLGLDGDGAHGPNECFGLDRFVKGIRASAAMLSRI